MGAGTLDGSLERSDRGRERVVAAVAGLVAIVPLMVLEWVTASDRPRSDFAFPLFVVMWFLVVGFVLGLFGVLRSARAMRTGHVTLLSLLWLMARIALLGWIAWVWTSGVIDQWPCFLGATGC